MPVIVDRDTINGIVDPLLQAIESMVARLDKPEVPNEDKTSDIILELKAMNESIVAAVNKLNKPAEEKSKPVKRDPIAYRVENIVSDRSGNILSADIKPT